MDKFQNKYRIPSARLQSWDYSWAGAYFITICTKNRLHYFGEIINENMQLSNAGIIANILWYEIKHHAKNIELGEFVAMPNHIHGILILNNDEINGTNVETRHALSLPIPIPPPTPNTGKTRFQNQGKNSVSSIIGAYKSAVTKHANRLNIEFAWQTRFYDHIIRDEKSFDQISNYISQNPINWKEDKFYINE